MVEADMKPLPFTVRVKADPPTVADAGDSEEIDGTGFGGGGGGGGGVPPPPHETTKMTDIKTATAYSRCMTIPVLQGVFVVNSAIAKQKVKVCGD